MLKRYTALFLAAVMILTLCACGSLFETEYYYSETYTDEIRENLGAETEVNNYSMLKAAIITLVSGAEEHGEFRISNYKGSVQDDLAAVCHEIETTNPIGAYAVESIRYDTSRIVSYYIVDIHVSYKRTAEEIGSIVNLSGTAELNAHIRAALNAYQEHLTLKMFSSQIDEAFITQQIRKLYFEDPMLAPLEPAIYVKSYPESGANRIYDIQLDYRNTPARLNIMTRSLDEAVQRVCASLPETDAARRSLALVAYLSPLCSQQEAGEEAYPDSAYGALVEGNADAKGIALAFRLLCKALDIECRVVEGGSSENFAAAHYWNIIRIEDAYYHVDISRFAADPEGAFLVSDEALWGSHIWETEDYPACSGPLSYWDYVERPVEGEEGGESNAAEEENVPSPAEMSLPEEKSENKP